MICSQNQLLPPVAGYDLIGDIHGCGTTLERLLKKMGYTKVRGVYQHPRRRVVFLGDIIDRGPHIREALLIAHSMVEQGSAEIVLGNHEINAILYCTKANDENTLHYLRSHTPNHARQIAETMEQFAQYPEEWNELLAWFAKLPLFLEFTNAQNQTAFRAVHACWDHALVNAHKARYGSGYFDKEFLVEIAQPNSIAARIKQRLTSGVDISLPKGVSLDSSDGYKRNTFRTKFWADQSQTYGELLFQPDPLPGNLAQEKITPSDREKMVHYSADEPPLFIGHYWLRGKPKPIAANIACLDYSAVKYGKLVAYRMDGEQQLKAKKFVWEYVDP